MTSSAPRPKAPLKPLVIAAALVVLLAGVGAVYAKRALSQGGPAVAVRALAQAVHARDAEAAMRWIDFDAVFEEAWRASAGKITGKEPTDQETAAALANPVVAKAKEAFRKNVATYVNDPERAGSDGGAFFAALNTLDEAKVEADGADKATVRLPNDYSLRLSKAQGQDWKVVAFHGYEKDYDAYKKKADDLLKDRGLAPPSVEDAAAAAASGDQPQP